MIHRLCGLNVLAGEPARRGIGEDVGTHKEVAEVAEVAEAGDGGDGGITGYKGEVTEGGRWGKNWLGRENYSFHSL